MSKAVLISIQPKWCQLIVNGEKTVEVRKSSPKLETPFKCYIYCTYGEGLIERSDICIPNMLIGQKVTKEKTWGNCCNGKVIGEFVCDHVYRGSEGYTTFLWDICVPGRLTEDEVIAYQGDASDIYGWHISDLVIYDKPKELSEFAKPGKCPYNPSDDGKCTYKYHCFRAGQLKRCGEFMQRAPQSWCYVEELPEGGRDHAIT